MQNALLSKQPLPTLIHNEKEFFLNFAQAEFIGLSLRGRDDCLEFTCKLGDDNGLVDLIHETSMTSQKLIPYLQELKEPSKILHADNLCDFFHPDTAKCDEINTILDGKKVIISLLHTLNNRPQASFFIIFCAKHYQPKNIEKGREIAHLLWELVAPFYDSESGTVYQACLHENISFENLTDREKEIARALLHNWSQAKIAIKTQLSVNTVKTHIKSIYLKYGVNSRIDFINHIFKR
jgi:DNA-binding CsgD family transcriptional regulator